MKLDLFYLKMYVLYSKFNAFIFKNLSLNELNATYLRVYVVVFQGSLEDFWRCFGLTSMFDRIWMEIVHWSRNLICFLWKCKSCTVTWKLLHFKNLSLNESKSDMFTGIPCQLSWQSWWFLPIFRFDLDDWSHLDGSVQWRKFCSHGKNKTTHNQKWH